MRPAHRSTSLLALALLAALAAPSARAAGADAPLDATQARAVFGEAHAVTARDGGRLWGLSLDGPLLLVDPDSRRVFASAPDSAGALRAEDGVWTTTLADSVVIANTATRWAGRLWTMLVWPLPADSAARRALLAHELWHRVQNVLGLPMRSPTLSSLDTRDGRLWLQLEWHALDAALAASGAARRAAVADALAFRAARRAALPGTAADEDALELNEGLAEYTGVALGHATPAARIAAARAGLRGGRSRTSFVRSFAYASGPAYGLLLDHARPGWRRTLRPGSDLGAMLDDALSVRASSADASARAAAYGGDTLRVAEDAREQARLARLARLRRQFVEDPVLRLPLRQPQVGFDPNGLVPLGPEGTLYSFLQVSDVWGVLEATGGALLAKDWSGVTVPFPADTTARPLRGPGWTLTLREGWRLAPGEREGDLRLRERP